MVAKFYNKFYDIERWLFYMWIVTMPIQALPKRYPIPTFMKDVPHCVLIVAFVFSMVFFIHNYDIRKEIPQWVKKYLTFCIVWPILCTGIGILYFPYWDASTDEFLRNTWLIQKIACIYHEILDNTFLLHLKYGQFLIYQTVNQVLLPLLGIPFIFWIAFKKKGNTYILQTLSKMALIVGSILAAYSLIETAWLLTDNHFLANILKTLYTCIWDPGTDKDHWWPMLLWKGRLRSFYGEPGHFGVMAMFILPFLWYRVFELEKKGTAILLVFFSFMVFMTHSRTALAVFGVEILVLTILSAISRYPGWKQYILRVLVATVLSFGLYVTAPIGVSWLSNTSYSPEQVEKFQSDISSITSNNQRSNGARLGNFVAKINVAKQHLLFGVGTNLESRYMVDNIPDFAKDNSEIKSWSKMTVQELGSGFASINEFAVILVEYGLIGLFLYLFPIAYLLVTVVKFRKILLKKFSTICILVAVCGQIACQFGTGLWLTYPTVMAIAYCVIFNEIRIVPHESSRTVLEKQ